MQHLKYSDQRGFTLIEAMYGAIVLSVMVLGMMTFFKTQSEQAEKLFIRQKAILAAHSQTERITALYTYTNFGATGPKATSGYTEVPEFSASRLIYPSNLDSWLGNGPDVIQSSVGSFSSKPFTVLRVGGASTALDRTYVMIDQARQIIARLSWTATDIVVNSCGTGGDCKCNSYSGGTAGNCQILAILLEYPYRLSDGAIVAPTKFETVSLRTIVGRGE